VPTHFPTPQTNPTVSVSEARAKAQEAQSNARLVSDPHIKKQWESIAAVWEVRIAELQGDTGLVPLIPPLNGASDPPPESPVPRRRPGVKGGA
jgi:hypothetical protein